MMLSKQAVADYLDRDFDSFLWMKRLARDTILGELAQMRTKPVFKTEPWLHQLVCFYIGLTYPRFLFLLDMGLGKSKIIMDLATQFQREKKMTRALVTVPRLINIDSWVEDIHRHSELEPWHVNVTDTEEKFERLINPQGDITIIDYAGLHLAMSEKVQGRGKKRELYKDDKKMRQLLKVYNFLAIDESHRLSNHETLWFSIMRQVSKRVDYCYSMTGTLFNKNPEAAWAQFFMTDRGETFGDTLGMFRGAFSIEKPHAFKGVHYVFNKRMDGKFHRMMQHRSLRYDEAEVQDLPKRVHRKVTFEMRPDQRDHYLRAVEGVIQALDKKRDAGAPWIRMRQICSGYLAWKDEHGDHVVYFKNNPKLDALQALIEDMGNTKCVVAYDYTPTGAMIVERVKKMGLGYEWFYGGTKDKTKSLERFKNDPKCTVLVMNSAAGGTGVDGLQKVASYMFLFESPSAPTERKQVIKRIHRAGQERRTFVYDLVCPGTVESAILESIEEGNDLYERCVNGKLPKLLRLLSGTPFAM